MNQQFGFGFGQSTGIQSTGYKPTGYVQSQYKGQLSKKYNPQQQPVIANQGGYSANQSASFGNTGWTSGNTPSYQSQQSFQSNSSSNAGTGPVISRFGYQSIGQSQFSGGMSTSGQTRQSGMNTFGQTQQSGSMNTFGQSQPFAGGMSFNQPQSGQQAQIHPVYQATNAQAQAGPVNSKLGWQQSR